MALLNRFFSSRKRPFARAQDNVSEKLFTFTNEQVRVIVFRECDFRGRKLLFDSRTVQKVALVDTPEAEPDQDPPTAKIVEVSKGHAYTYTKPIGDVARLGEMIFGSVAMSFRGTTYKIHSVPVPAQLICSQVFPSPKNPLRLRRSAPSHVHTGSSIEHSIRLEDSGASSATSGSDQSVLSGASDTILVCKRQQSVPLDVPVNFSLVSSSGYGEEHSYSSISSGPQSIPVDLSQGVHSGDSLNKRWPWSTNASLDPSTGSLPGSVSADESFHKVRSSKIGLAVLIELTDGEEEKLEQFIMEHAALIEMLMWRVRRSVEGAYIRHGTFVSVMHDISAQTAHWLVDLLNGARALVQTWHSHFPNCDNLFSIIKKSPSISFLGHLTDSSPKRTLHSDDRDAVRFSTLVSGGLFSGFKSDPSGGCAFESGGGEFSFVNLSRFLKSEHATGTRKEEGVLLAEKFVKEFCELLESVDVKHTNFFISTLVTAVLTHHLGWVNTVLPVTLKPNKPQSSNPFWSQLTELYGAIGYPLKMSRTVVSGSNKSDLVPKILNALKYFIRCSDVSRRCQVRVNIDWENESADAICSANSCIPKENYKKYEDHLREIEEFTKAEIEQQVLKLKMPNKSNRKLELTKTHTCLSELGKLCENQEKHSEILDRVTNMRLQAINPGDKIDVTCSFLKNINHEEQQLVDINEAKQQIERVFSPKKKFGDNPENSKTCEDASPHLLLKSSKSLLKIIPAVDEIDEVHTENNNVVFVLGENEELVGIKTPTKRPTELPLKDFYHTDDNSAEALRTEFCLEEKPLFCYSPETTSVDFTSLSSSTNQSVSINETEKLLVLKEKFQICSGEESATVENSHCLSVACPKSKKTKKEKSQLTRDETIVESNLNIVCPKLSTASSKREKFKTIADFSINEIDNHIPHFASKLFVSDSSNYSKNETTEVEFNKSDDDFKTPSTSSDFNMRTNFSNEVLHSLTSTEFSKSTPEICTKPRTLKKSKSTIFQNMGFLNAQFQKSSPELSAAFNTAAGVSPHANLDYDVLPVMKSKTKLCEDTLCQKYSHELGASSEKFKSKICTEVEPPFKIPFSAVVNENHTPEVYKMRTPLTKSSPEMYEMNKSSGERFQNSRPSHDRVPIKKSTRSKNKMYTTQLKKSSEVLEFQKSTPDVPVFQQVVDLQKYSPEGFEFKKSSPVMFDSSKLLEFEKPSPKLVDFQKNSPEVLDFRKSPEFEEYLPEILEPSYKTAALLETSCIDTPVSSYEDLSPFKNSDFSKNLGVGCIIPSTSFTTEKQLSPSKTQRASSEPPLTPKPIPCTSTKYKYTGVKFNFQQYPQIVENYMKNKNIDLSNMQFSEKKLDFRWQSSESTFDFSQCDDAGGNYEEGGEPLTTPSNATELEFTSEFVVSKAEEVVEVPCRRLEFTRNVLPNTVIKEPNPYEHAKLLKDARNRRISEERTFSNLKIVELPMPRSQEVESHFPSIDYTNSLIRDLDDHYVSDMVLQGTSAPKYEWEQLLKKDLVLSTQHSFSNQQVEESIAIVANTDTWEVQLMSSHTYVIDRSAAGVPVGMSQLVANMLETLLHMWRLHTPAEYCLMHIEQQLQEFCLRSKALAQLLLDTDFCSMEILTSTLRLEVNDVPLLMAIASTHTPQVTQKYGLSFQ